MSLKAAREKSEEARRPIGAGVDPGVIWKANKATAAGIHSSCFEAVAREWHKRFAPAETPAYAAIIERRLALYVYPWIGSKPVAALTAPELVAVVQRIEERGTLETARRVLQIIGQVMRYSVRSASCYAPSTATAGRR